eukprot:CAMPEP_0180674974 /NCGR_PEP_ID=MMETSP1037_2-20121125/66513_1 /TAXON_ID=632150 /ORGANISM="Azadinium spinosum, Strain 3D9" /LENGTH=56 /DNA_ID=CAMNT_0022704343 /DNA_START=219 /DNA_END=389 /DNA_ORIENTATION=+
MAQAEMQKVLKGTGKPSIAAQEITSTTPEIITTRPLCEITVRMAGLTSQPLARSSA